MPLEPLRFLHAANVRLDQVIGGADRLVPSLASIVEDAPRAAFECLIAAAVNKRVDFLLLSGNTFAESEESLAARLALFDGFAQLADESIQVFVLPGALDPAEAWRQIPGLPEHVTLIDDNPRAAQAVRRGEAVLARIGARLHVPPRKMPGSRKKARRANDRGAAPFQIGARFAGDDADSSRALAAWSAGGDPPRSEAGAPASSAVDRGVGAAVDYLALGGGRRRTLVRQPRIAHDPGPLQAGGPHETGACGCTLVNVEPDGTVHCDFVPTAAVRWERSDMPVCRGADHAALLGRCREVLAAFRPEPSESAWVFEWVLRGSREALAVFDDESSLRQLERDLSEATVVPKAESVVHRIVFELDLGASVRSPADDPLESDFVDALSQLGPLSVGELNECLAELRRIDPGWAARIESLALELRPELARLHADRLGRRLLRHPLAEGAAG